MNWNAIATCHAYQIRATPPELPQQVGGCQRQFTCHFFKMPITFATLFATVLCLNNMYIDRRWHGFLQISSWKCKNHTALLPPYHHRLHLHHIFSLSSYIKNQKCAWCTICCYVFYYHGIRIRTFLPSMTILCTSMSTDYTYHMLISSVFWLLPDNRETG